MRQNKNLVLLGLLLLLSVLAFFLLKSREENIKNEIGHNAGFNISAGASPDSIVLKKEGDIKVFKEAAGEWYLNEDIRVRDELQDALILILKRVQVKRPVSGSEQKQLAAIFDSASIRTEIYQDGNLLNAFDVWGNRETKTTYARLPEEEGIYIVDIPGYSTYIADIFFLKASDWRSSLLFESTWRSLKSVRFKFPKSEEDNYEIVAAGEFLKVTEVSALDTVALVTFLDEFSRIKIRNYFPSESVILDSLRDVVPDLVIAIDDFEEENTNAFQFYTGFGETGRQVAVIGKDQEAGLIPQGDFEKLNKKVTFFERK